MKLAGAALADFLRRPRPGGAALVYGPDNGLARERAQLIMQAMLGSSPTPFALSEFGEEAVRSEPALLYDALRAQSLMGGQHIVLLRDATDKCAPAVQAALENIPTDAFLLVCGGDLPARSTLRQLFEPHPVAASLPCYADDAAAIEQLVRSMLAEAGKTCDSGVPRLLAAQLGNDRGVTRSELLKICQYLGDEKYLSLEVAQSLITQNQDASLEAVSNAVANRNPAVLEAALSRLFYEGIAPVAVLRAVLRYFQRLQLLAGLTAEGIPLDAAVSGLRPPVFFNKPPCSSVMRAAGPYPL